MKFLLGKKADFIDFLNSVNKRDRIAIISHNDLDGLVSVLLVSEILKFKKMKIKSLNFINYKRGMLKELHSNLVNKKINKVFILDINVSSDYEGFEELRNEFDIFLIDHHPSEIKGKNIIKTQTEDCVAFVIYEVAKKLFDLKKWNWLVCSTMISEFSYNDKSNFNFIKKSYPEVTEENINDSVPGKVSKEIASALIYFKGKEKKVFHLLLKNKIKKFRKYHKIIEKEIENTVKKFKENAEFYPEKNLYFYYYTPKFSMTSVVVTILSVENGDKTFVFVSDVDNNPEFVKVSARNQGGKEDINLLMKKGIEDLENATAGGHFKASGARFMKKDLEKFKKNILNINR